MGGTKRSLNRSRGTKWIRIAAIMVLLALAIVPVNAHTCARKGCGRTWTGTKKSRNDGHKKCKGDGGSSFGGCDEIFCTKYCRDTFGKMFSGEYFTGKNCPGEYCSSNGAYIAGRWID